MKEKSPPPPDSLNCILLQFSDKVLPKKFLGTYRRTKIKTKGSEVQHANTSVITPVSHDIVLESMCHLLCSSTTKVDQAGACLQHRGGQAEMVNTSCSTSSS